MPTNSSNSCKNNRSLDAEVCDTEVTGRNENESTSRKSNTSDSTTSQEYLIYFVRHGEAKHNVLEKAAQKKAREESIRQGYESDDSITRSRMEDARCSVLNDSTLLDSPLTCYGKKEAKGAHNIVNDLIATNQLPSPPIVLVSPLQRALQTADIVFPDHEKIYVRDELKERQTGKPCDKRSPSSVLLRRKTFSRFDMTALQISSFKLRKKKAIRRRQRIKSEMITSTATSLPMKNDGVEGAEIDLLKTPSSSPRNDFSSSDTLGLFNSNTSCQIVEEKPMLRERTKLLFGVLHEINEPVVAVIGHKGYLRELERGPLGQVNATEFKNCEVRVYKIRITTTVASSLSPTTDDVHIDNDHGNVYSKNICQQNDGDNAIRNKHTSTCTPTTTESNNYHHEVNYVERILAKKTRPV